MTVRERVIGVVVLAGMVLVPACTSTMQPSSSASVASPQPRTPANSAQIIFTSQPVTLTVQNAVVTNGTATTYTFEVATDPAFGSKVQTKDGITQGSNGLTSVVLDALTGGRDYYWHVRATSADTVGVFGPTSKFTVGPPITIAAPVPIAPLTGGTGSPRPALRVANAVKQGPSGPLTYRFEVATTSAFTTIVASGTNVEGINETGFIPTSDLPLGTLFWRATATDTTNNVTSASSASQSFTVIPFTQAERLAQQIGATLWPGIQPPGTVGHATMGDNWSVQTLHHLPTNTFFKSPSVEDLRIFDLLDRGFDPEGAINWMNQNGYQTFAQWYPPPEKAVIGLAFTYIAARNKITVNGIWDIVLKAE
jgi:hypothetical protein